VSIQLVTIMLTWKRHLSEYRSDKGYTIRSPQRGSYWTLLSPQGELMGRYPKLMGAKEAAENREVLKQKQEFQVGRNGHEVFDTPWGCFDVTVARKLAPQRGQADHLVVQVWAEAKHQACLTQPETTGPIVVLTTNRRGVLASLVVDGWAQILRAHAAKAEQLDCLVLGLEDTALVRIT
jgi:hypothetical protein